MTATLRRVPLLDLAPQNGPIEGEILAAITKVVRRQAFILGGEVTEFEREIAAYGGVEHAVGCASGTDALMLALQALGIGSGDEVLTTPFSFFATVSSIVRIGARPVFADIDERSFNLSPESVAEAADRHPGIKALIPVHLFGGCARMDELGALARDQGWLVIEDAAQSVGAEFEGKRAGSMGNAGCLSFFPSKNLGAMGDAGAVTTQNEDLANRLRALRVHGARTTYLHEWVGMNSRLDEIQAAVLRVKLRYLDDWTAGRQRNAARYHEILRGERLPLVLPEQDSGQTRHVFNQFVVRCVRRNDLREHLARHGVGTQVYYPVPLHLQPCFSFLGYKAGDLPNAERACQEVLALPVHSGMLVEDLEYVCEQLKGFFRGVV